MSGTRLACLALALLVHGTCMALAKTARVSVPALEPRTTQVEVALIEKPKPPPDVAPTLPPEAAPAPELKRTRRVQPPPERASAAPVLTRAPSSAAPTAAEPVRFVSDPNGQRFGYGVVARGGRAEHGQAPPPAPTPRATGDERIATRVSRAPALLAPDGCRGFFPSGAQRDGGAVSVIATVRASGALARLEVEHEDPEGQGFGRAARACLERQRFSPALDLHGAPVAARTRIRIQFER